ncbi:hypothetical protein [Aquimarina algiphila]|uniref:Uncharacterized protein n=1 Tax=Aquimarina algiphila TaxID=2047982 RepID=A0A554VNP7_9FLAO|nr:hypothetical protein [Aquimarina algiphila]TSE09993.1 hypothetical protein FOF46_06745 [Aquimarina algiphila]
MNTINNVKSFFLFERKVCDLLRIEQCHFATYVNQNRGYALLLRNWIKESHQKGDTANEVAQTIKRSKLLVDNINFL